MYDPDGDEPTEAAARLIEASYAADGLIWSSPMYQGTSPGVEECPDWLHPLGDRDPPYLHDKVIGLICAAGGTRDCRRSTRWSSAFGRFAAGQSPTSSRSPAAARMFDDAGRVKDQAVELQLKTLGAEVVRVAERFAADSSLHRQAECAQAAERAAVAA